MATLAQQLSPATALPMLGKKRISSPSITSYPPLFVAPQDTMFSSSVDSWMPKYEFSLYNSSNRNEEYVTDFTQENKLTFLNIRFQKRKGELWTYANNTKALIDYVFINKKWNDSASNCEAYSSFKGVSSDHRIITTEIQLRLRRNGARTTTTVHYNWSLLNNWDIRDKYTLKLRNKFDTLQEISETPTPNDENENFVNAHLEVAAECIPTKQRTKPRVPCETLVVRIKRADVKTFKCNRWNPTNINAQKLKKAQNEFTNIYLKEQTEYIQNQINKIRDSVESRIAWQTVNKVSRRECTAKAKLKATSQEERIHLGKQHFENLLGKPPKVTHEPITKITSNQLNIKLEQFTQEELNSVLRNIKNREATGLDEILPEVGKTGEIGEILLQHCNAQYNQNIIDWGTEGCILPFSKKGELGIAKYRGITLTSIAAKIYNAQLCNCIEPKILRKNQNGFRRNRSTSQILTIPQILLYVQKPWGNNIIRRLLQGLWLHTQREDGTNTTRLWPTKETVAATMMLYKNTKVKDRSPDGDADNFDIIAGVLQGDTLTPYLFIICLDFVLRMSINLMKENSYKLAKKETEDTPHKQLRMWTTPMT